MMNGAPTVFRHQVEAVGFVNVSIRLKNASIVKVSLVISVVSSEICCFVFWCSVPISVFFVFVFLIFLRAF